jgi:hypothetical protein
MVEQTTFMGMPLRTQGQRRTLVLAYYAVFLLFAGVILWKSDRSIGFMIPQVVTLGGLLGGIKVGGPVKAYSESMVPVSASGLQTLNLAGRKPFDDGLKASLLDERERLQRDYAHYTAYRILRWTLAVAIVMYWMSLDWTYTWLSTKGPGLAWILLVYVLSLPQSVLLWTEQDLARGELVEIQRA